MLVCCKDHKFTDHKFTAISVVNIFYEKMYFGLKRNDLVISHKAVEWVQRSDDSLNIPAVMSEDSFSDH